MKDWDCAEEPEMGHCDTRSEISISCQGTLFIVNYLPQPQMRLYTKKDFVDMLCIYSLQCHNKVLPWLRVYNIKGHIRHDRTF